MSTIIKLCLKDNCDPCPWRRRRENGDGIPLNRRIKRCANMRGCVWEICHEVSPQAEQVKPTLEGSWLNESAEIQFNDLPMAAQALMKPITLDELIAKKKKGESK